MFKLIITFAMLVAVNMATDQSTTSEAFVETTTYGIIEDTTNTGSPTNSEEYSNTKFIDWITKSRNPATDRTTGYVQSDTTIPPVDVSTNSYSTEINEHTSTVGPVESSTDFQTSESVGYSTRVGPVESFTGFQTSESTGYTEIHSTGESDGYSTTVEPVESSTHVDTSDSTGYTEIDNTSETMEDNSTPEIIVYSTPESNDVHSTTL